MNSPWLEQTKAVFFKEIRTDWRTKHGLFVGGLFVLLATIAMGFATMFDGQQPSPDLTAGMLVVTILFSGATVIPRIFLAEEDQGTFELLRLFAAPGPAYAGKLFYALLQMILVATVSCLMFVEMVQAPVVQPVFLLVSAFVFALALGGGLAFASSLVLGAANRWMLASAVGIPLLMPVVVLGIICLRYSFGVGRWGETFQSLIGLGGMALFSIAIGPALAPWLWGLAGQDKQSPNPNLEPGHNPSKLER